MSRTLQLKQATISALSPTRYARTSETLNVGYSTVGFEIISGNIPDPEETLEIGYSTVSFEIKHAVPPNSRENMGIGYSTEGFALKRHPDFYVGETLGSTYSTVGFVLKTHPSVGSGELMGVAYDCRNFEFTGSPSSSGQWDPFLMTVAPQVILDDRSSVTDVGGFASQWYNRATSAWHATQASAGDRPAIITNDAINRRLLRFNGDFMSVSGAGELLRVQESGWLFVTVRKAAVDLTDVSRRVVEISNNASPGTTPRLAIYNADATSGDANKLKAIGRRTDAGASSTVKSTATIDTDWTLALVVADYTARTLTMYIDGVQDAVTTGAFDAAGLVSNTDSYAFTLGASASGTEPWNGDMACVLAGRGVPTPTEIDRLFGYYANRYNLRDLLPSDHPYKNNPPYPFVKVIDFQFEGTNGSTSFTDAGGSIWTAIDAVVSTSDKKVGAASYYCAPNVSTGGLTTASYSYIFDLSVQDFCIQAWVQPQGNFGVNSAGAVISRFGANSSSRMWALWRDQANNRMVFTWGDSGAGEKTIASANGSVPVDAWAHVAVTRWKNVLKLYINGTLAATGTIVGTILNSTNSAYVPRVGYTDRVPNSAWGGYIDQLSVTRGDPVYWGDFPVDLAATQNDGVPSQLVALMFHADGANNSTALIDSGPNGRTFVPSGGAKLSTTNPVFGGACMVFDGSWITQWIGQPDVTMNPRAGAFQWDWRFRLDSPIGNDVNLLMMLSYTNGAFYIPYEWALRVGRKALSFYYGTRGVNQSVINMILPDGINLDNMLGVWNAMSLGRDAAGNWMAWINGQRCPTYQVSPLSPGYGLGAETAGPYVNAVDLGSLTSPDAVRVGGFFADPGTAWIGGLDEFRYVVGTCRDVTKNYSVLPVPFSNGSLYDVAGFVPWTYSDYLAYVATLTFASTVSMTSHGSTSAASATSSVGLNRLNVNTDQTQPANLVGTVWGSPYSASRCVTVDSNFGNVLRHAVESAGALRSYRANVVVVDVESIGSLPSFAAVPRNGYGSNSYGAYSGCKYRSFMYWDDELKAPRKFDALTLTYSYVQPGNPWKIAWRAPLGTNDGGWADDLIRVRIPAANFKVGTKLRVRLVSSDTQALTFASVYVGLATAGANVNFAGPPSKLTFGGSDGLTIPLNDTAVSDAISFVVDGSADLIISVKTTSGGTFLAASGGGTRHWYKNGPGPTEVNDLTVTGGVMVADYTRIVCTVETF